MNKKVPSYNTFKYKLIFLHQDVMHFQQRVTDTVKSRCLETLCIGHFINALCYILDVSEKCVYTIVMVVVMYFLPSIVQRYMCIIGLFRRDTRYLLFLILHIHVEHSVSNQSCNFNK